MIEIEYKGANGITIKSNQSKMVIDPKLSLVKLKDQKTAGNIELSTEERFALNDPEALVVINGPGEYGVADFDITGFSALRHIDGEGDELLSTIYRIEIGSEARIGIIGNITGKLSDEQYERIGVVDILVLPVGGNGYTLDAKEAVEIVKNIEPKVVIPVSYADKGVIYEVPQDDSDLFTKELGVQNIETVTKYKVKSASALPEVMTIVKIERS